MGYFGGLGAGKGWYKFQILICADVLREVLRNHDLWLVVTNGRVSPGYRFTAVDDYVAAYGRYLDAMMASGKEARKAANDVYMGVVASLDTLAAKTCPDPNFKVMDPLEPVVNLGPLMLHYDGDRLSTNVYSDVYFGLVLKQANGDS